MAKKIQTVEELEQTFDCRISHVAELQGSNIIRGDLNRCCSARKFFNEGLPNKCTYCGTANPKPTTLSSQLQWYKATTWTCSECSTVMTTGTTGSNKQRGLTFINGTVDSNRLVGENTITTDQSFNFYGIQNITTKIFAPQYIMGLCDDSGWTSTDILIQYNGTYTINFTKVSGNTDMSIKAVYEDTYQGNKRYRVYIKYSTWVSNTNGYSMVSNNRYFKYNITVTDSTTTLVLNIEKAGHSYVNDFCTDRYRTLWVDGFDGNFINFHSQYRSWSGSSILNGLGAGADGVIPIIYLPDYATKSAPTGLPIIINNKGINTEAGVTCTPRFYDCGGNGCGTIQYYYFDYNTNWDGEHIGNPILRSSCNISPRLNTIYGPYTADGCGSLQNFFENTGGGGGGYHYGDSSLEYAKFGWIMIDPAILEGISTWQTLGLAILFVTTGEDLTHPACQMQNAVIRLSKNNSYYVLN